MQLQHLYTIFLIKKILALNLQLNSTPVIQSKSGALHSVVPELFNEHIWQRMQLARNIFIMLQSLRNMNVNMNPVI